MAFADDVPHRRLLLPLPNQQLTAKLAKLLKNWQKFEHDFINANLATPLVIDLILQARKRFAVSSYEVAVRQYMQKVLTKIIATVLMPRW